MIVLNWSGAVGWDIWADAVKQDLINAAGDDITVNFSSVGGDVFEGVEIYNAISDYHRNFPKSTIIFEIKGVMASMGSYIPSNPAISEVKIEENVSYMIHNPWNFAIGDYNKMAKVGEFLEGLAGIMALSYSKRSGMSLEETRALMDSEKWYFGQEIIDAGFADSIIPAPENSEPKARAQVISMAKMQFSNMQKKFRELSEEKEFDENRAAAILKTKIPEMKIDNKNKQHDENKNKPVPNGKINGGSPKVETKAELKNELPGVYAESVNDGVKKERERVAALMAMKKEEGYKKLPSVLAVIDEAIESGKDKNETLPLIMAAIMAPEAQASLDSPDDITGGNDEPPAQAKTGKKIREV